MSDQVLLDLQETLYRSKNPTRRWLHTRRRDWIFSALDQYAPIGCARALEVGPGDSGYLLKLGSLCEELVVSNIEVQFLENAQKTCEALERFSAVEDDLSDSRLESDSFDLILCTEVLEHIPDPVAAMKELFRILKPGGRLILSTPQKYSTLEVCSRVAYLPGIISVVRRIYDEPILDAGHISLMTAGHLMSTIEECGFTTLERRKDGLYLPVVAESLGHSARDLSAFLVKRLRGRSLEWLLWTQYYVLEKAPS